MKSCVSRKWLAALAASASLAAGSALHAATIFQGSKNAYVSFEAETAATVINGTQTTWGTADDLAASGGKVLSIGGTTDNGTSPHSYIQYEIKFATPGTYNLYYRWKADAVRTVADQFTANSCWIPNDFGRISTPGADSQGSFHTAASNGTQAPGNNVYDWQREADTATYTVTQEQINAGVPLVFTVGTREAGMFIDRWVLSPDATLSDAALDALSNSDTSVVTQGAGESFLSFEAEARGTVINGTQTFWGETNDPPASAGSAIVIGGTTDNGTSPHSFVQYQVKFATPGTYSLYYRWKADAVRTVADQFTANSCWIPNDFGALSTPGADAQGNFHTAASNGTQAPGNNVYDWQREADTATYTVTQEQVNSGTPLVFSIGSREAGMIIDRWVFSTDATLTDAALDALPNSGAKAAGPELAKAVGSASLNTARLFFTKTLAPASVAANKFTVDGGLTVNSATLDTTDPRQVLLTTSAQTQGTVYTVSVNNVTDTSGAATAPGAKAAFTAWKLVDGWATTEIYMNITGTTVDDLKNAPAYQNRTPDELRWVKGFQLNNDPRAPNVGARISALFKPSASGAYAFYVNNDNEAELQLSTDESEAGLQSLNVFPLSPAVFDDNISAPSPALTSGKRYLLVGLLKSDGADVYMNVAAQPGSASAPAASLPVLRGSSISTFVNPDLGTVTFAQQPANAQGTDGARARFEVKAKANEAPIYYQWQVNGVDIPGATRSAYVTPILSSADTGKKYRVVVSVAGRDTPSAEASLTVASGEVSNLQPYIGINFVGGGDNLPGALTPVDVAGVVLQENWNNLTGFDFSQAALKDAAGASTPVTFSATATEHWYSGTLGAGDANGVLLQGFLSTGASTEPFTMTLSGVPTGAYHLIVYSVGFPFQASYEEGISLTGSGSYPTYHVKAESGLEYNATPVFRQMSSTDANSRAAGNYVQFENVSPAADGSLAISTTWESTNVGNTHQPAINGIQLVKVGPATQRPPSISTALQGTGLTLSWGASAAGFTLESSGKLGAGASWQAVTGVANPIAGSGSTVVTTSTGTAFYRLKK